jgi:iron complex outermembrane receptor protein
MVALALLLALQDSAPAAPRLLDSIVVRAGVLAATPLSRTSLGTHELSGARSGQSLDESLARLAGVVVQPRGTFALDTRLVIRGAGARSAFGVRGVTVILDGMPQTLPDGQAGLGQVDIAALRRVDVVRGAAGAFYGNGAGGVLIMEASPGPFAPPFVRARGSAGSHGASALHATAHAAAPGAGGGVFVSAGQSRQDGYRNYSAGLVRQAAAGYDLAGRARWLRARLRASDLVRAENPGALDSAQLANDPTQANARNVAFRAGKRATEWQGSLAVAGPFARGFGSTTVFGLARTLDNPLASAWVKLDRRDAGARFDANWVAGPHGRVQLRAGADVQRQVDDRRNFANDSGRVGTSATLDQRETVTALGARAAVTAPLSARTAVTAGLRLDRVAFGVRDELTGDGDASARRALGAVSWTAAVERRGGAWRGWASAGTAFETPTTTELARPGTGGFNLELEPQRTLQGEIGVERATPGQRLAVSLYRSAIRDGLVQREEPAMPGRFYFVNAARVSLAGIEAEAATRVTAWLTLTGSLTLTRHRYDRFPTDSTPLDGRFVPGLPRATAYALASFGRATAPGRGPVLDVEVVSQGRMYADDANSAFAAGWTQLHLRAGWAMRHLTAFGGVRNATDARVVGSVNVNGALRRFYEPAPGRTFYAGVETRID